MLGNVLRHYARFHRSGHICNDIFYLLFLFVLLLGVTRVKAITKFFTAFWCFSDLLMAVEFGHAFSGFLEIGNNFYCV